METEVPPIAAGETLGRYKILGEIGRGAMAVVYLAEESGRGRYVAVKILLPKYEGEESYVNRFINEARAAASLSHPNIIEALDIGCEKGMHYFCMEYVDGNSLQELITSEGKVPVERLLDIVIEVAEALEYGWTRHGLTHGDIKPENIMLKSTGEAKLADFGLANMIGHEREESEILLTPHYAAPELIMGTAVKGDCRTDIYALGATIYHALSGAPVFQGTNAQEVLDRQVHENPEPLMMRCPEAPLLLSQLVGRMLSKQTADRPQDWTSVLQELRAIRSGLVKSSVNVPLQEEAAPVIINDEVPSDGIRPVLQKYAKPLKIGIAAVIVLACVVVAILLIDRAFGKKQVSPDAAEPGSSQTQAVPFQTETVPSENVEAVEPNIVKPVEEERPSMPKRTEANVRHPVPKHTEPKVRPSAPRAKHVPGGKKASAVPTAEPKARPKPQQPKEVPFKKPLYTSVPDIYKPVFSKEYLALEANYASETDLSKKRTVEFVRELKMSCRSENVFGIAYTAKKIQDDRTLQLTDEDRAVIEELRSAALRKQPVNRGRELIDAAEENVKSGRYVQALGQELVARARYGAKSRVARDAAKMKLTVKKENALDGSSSIGLSIPFTRPLNAWEYDLIYSGDYANASQNDESVALLAPVAELYMGELLSATDIKVLGNERMNRRDRKDNAPQKQDVNAAFSFAETLLCEYLWDDGKDWSWIDAAVKPNASGECRAGVLSMAAASAIIGHCPHWQNITLPWTGKETLAGDSRERRLLAYLLYAWFSEAEDSARLGVLRQDMKLHPSKYGFSAAPSLSNGSMKLEDPEDSELQWAMLLAWVYQSSTAKGLAQDEDAAVLKMLSANSGAWPLHAGEALYCWLLNRCAYFLNENDLASAAVLTRKLLEIDAVCMIPYYGRIQALYAGLMILDGRPSVYSSILSIMDASNAVSSSTLGALKNISDTREAARVFRQLPSGKVVFIWHGWLRSCFSVYRSRRPAPLDNVFLKCHPHLAEQRLLSSLPK